MGELSTQPPKKSPQHSLKTSTKVSSALMKTKKKLEDIMDRSFSHDVWKYGHLVSPNQPDSEDDEQDPNLPLEWDAMSRQARKKKLCEDLKLTNNPILDADPVHGTVCKS